MTRVIVGLVLLIGGTAAAALTLTPPYHNFGKVAVMGTASKTFTTTLPSGVTSGTLTYSVTGPDAADFLGDGTLPFGPSTGCSSSPQGLVCEWSVEFRPRSLGPSRAFLAVSDGLGSMTTATLEGEGVAAICKHTVVPCNYAHHYSGVVSWSGEGGHANVDVVEGVASCNAAGGDGGGMTSGPGLIGVEFDRSIEMDARRSFTWYRITVACPIRYASEPGYPPEPIRPAELGHDEFGSYKQPLGMTIDEAQASPPKLKGSNNEAGDIVSWDLCPNAVFRPAVRVRDSRRQGRCP
jgi:hypothetical protein